jgi:MFS family permease
LRFRLSLLMFLMYAPAGAVLPLFSLHLQRLGFTPVEIGWSFAPQALASMIAPIIAGQVADRWIAAERCLFVCALASGILFWILGMLTTPLPVFLAALAVWMVMQPAITLGTSICLANLAAPEREFGRVRLWGTLGWVAPNWLLALWLLDPSPLASFVSLFSSEWTHGGLRDEFQLASVLAFVLAGYSLTLPHTPPRHRLGQWLAPLGAFRLLREPSFAVFALGTFGVTLTLSFNSQTSPLLLERLHVSDGWIPFLLTFAQAVEVLTLLLLPMLLLRLETRGTMLFGLGLWAVSLGVLAMGEPLWRAVLALGGWGVIVCCYLVAGQVYVNSRARGDLRTSAQALHTCVSSTGVLVGNRLAGGIREASGGDLGPVYWTATVIASVVAVVFLIGFRPNPKSE